ncbi:hypothetical protein UFOVP264_24 [uncultured Caudovirales phage]|uniref:Uncharacterized protein n=1 Tax=uncultured Caudovirales phage TaxID=2100421 RepID=A0A6J5LGI6_9CAUD|nr:hypothetical protein UFOVP264_24 [uncultured Caudovirales phage]
MLDKIASQFKSEFQMGHMSAVMNHAANLINIFRADFMKDGDAKNAVIDAFCELLQSQKDKPAATIEDSTNG